MSNARQYSSHCACVRSVHSFAEASGVIPAGGFLGAYALHYADGLESMHGSLFGIQLFYRGRAKARETVDDFLALTAQHLAGVLFAVFLALSRYLRAFCMLQRFEVLDGRLKKTFFDRFMDAVRGTETLRV